MEHKPDRTLSREDLADDALDQFRRWYDDAEAEGIDLPNAMALATAGAEGMPSIRHVLLRGFDARGFLFYTNYESRKGRELAASPHAAITLLWKELDRQVCVTGDVARVSREESRVEVSDIGFTHRRRQIPGIGAHRAWKCPHRGSLGPLGR